MRGPTWAVPAQNKWRGERIVREITSGKPQWDSIPSYYQEHCYNVRIFSARHNTGWAVSRAQRNYVECDVKQCNINGVEYLFLSFDV